MSAQLKALTIQNGDTRRILDGTMLDVARGITGPAALFVSAEPTFDLTLEAGTVVGLTDNGGNVTIGAASSGANSGVPGLVQIFSGDAGADTQIGGKVRIAAGSGGGTAGLGGNIELEAGSGTADAGGNILGVGGTGQVGDGGIVRFTGGTSNDGSVGGGVFLLGGSSSGGTAGLVSLDGGAVGANGNVHIGTNRAPGVTANVYLGAAGTGGAANNFVNIHNPSGGNALNDGLLTVACKKLSFKKITGGDSPGVGYTIQVDDSTANNTEGCPLVVKSASATVGNGAGGNLTLSSGNASGVQVGGNVVVTAGNAPGAGAGGNVDVTAGASSTGDGGLIALTGGTSGATGIGGEVILTGGTGAVGVSTGGDVSLIGGPSSVTAGAIPGMISLTGGRSFSDQTSGGVSIASGKAGTGGTGIIDISTPPAAGTGGAGGDINVTSGDSVGITPGSNINLKAGNNTDDGAASGTGGLVTMYGGDAVGVFGGDGGAIDIAGGAANVGGAGTGGAVFITGGQGSAGAYAGGAVNINGGAGTTAGKVVLGQTNTLEIDLYANTIVQANKVLSCVATGYIDLPGASATAANNFAINGTHVHNVLTVGQVTAPNLDTLTAGPASDASALHTHTGISGATTVVFTAVSSESIAVGAPVTVEIGVGTVRNGEADVAVRQNCVGLSQSAAVGSIPVIVSGVQTVAAAVFDAALAVGVDEGKPVYVSNTQGKLTVTAPDTGFSSVQKVGTILTVAGGGASANVIVSIGDITVLPA
jgi:hypothetical protein